MNALLILIGKLFSLASKALNLGSGSTWPGHIALFINKNFIKEIIDANPHLKIILIAGTNGKTTTGRLIQSILKKTNYKVFQNESGANLLNGIASSLLLHSSVLSTIDYDFAIFEVDENTLSLVLDEITPSYLILLNLFRDQLDRYGEVNTIASKWDNALEKLSSEATLVLNADDPQIAYLSKNAKQKASYFGLNDKKLAESKGQHASDSTYCPNCSSKLIYNSTYYSHLGDWKCEACQYKRPKDIFSTVKSSPLIGVYNAYNILAASLVAKNLGVIEDSIIKSLKTFSPAFGRQEQLGIDGKKVQLFLSKNPTSFNESLRTIASLNAKKALLVLSDRIPDGRDVSWIWDVDFEDYIDSFETIIVSGDRAYDMGIRIKYAFQTQNSRLKPQNYISKLKIYENLNDAIKESLKKLAGNETLYILPTYSAMLEVRKILLGKKIL